MKNIITAEPAWVAEEVAWIKTEGPSIHEAHMRGAKAAVLLGMRLANLKAAGKADGWLPHGQFEKFRAEHFPEFSERMCCYYMSTWNNAAEGLRLTKAEIAESAEARQLPSKVDEALEGKSLKQALLDFGAMKQDPDGNLVKRVGRATGEGGLPKLTLSEKAARAEAHARQAVFVVAKELAGLGADFAMLPDAELFTVVNYLRESADLIADWLHTATDRRDPHALEAKARKLYRTKAVLKKSLGLV